jgi:hypothetical protein
VEELAIMVGAILFAQRDRLPELRTHSLDLVVAQCALLIDANRVECARLVERARLVHCVF